MEDCAKSDCAMPTRSNVRILIGFMAVIVGNNSNFNFIALHAEFQAASNPNGNGNSQKVNNCFHFSV
jgi:hypothetical protein